MLDIGLGILRMHETRDGAFQLTAVHHDRRIHREMIILAGMIDVRVRVANIADIADFHAVARELVLDHVLVVLQTAHSERFHDRVVTIAGIDDDRILPAKDQKAIDRHTFRPPAAATQHEEARLQLDIAEVQHFDFQRHHFTPCITAGRPGSLFRKRLRAPPRRYLRRASGSALQRPADGP